MALVRRGRAAAKAAGTAQASALGKGQGSRTRERDPGQVTQEPGEAPSMKVGTTSPRARPTVSKWRRPPQDRTS